MEGYGVESSFCNGVGGCGTICGLKGCGGSVLIWVRNVVAVWFVGDLELPTTMHWFWFWWRIGRRCDGGGTDDNALVLRLLVRGLNV